MRALRGAFVASLLISTSASATEQDRPFQLKYEAPAECPSGADVSARIRASTAHARPAQGDEPRYEMTLVVSRGETGFLASLAVRLPDGSQTARTVPAPRCKEAVDAAALILAITIDPEAAAPEIARSNAQPEAKPPTTPAPQTQQGPEANPPKPEPPGAKPEPKPPEAAPKVHRSPPKAPRDRLLVDAGVGFVALALSPKLTPDFALGVAYEPALGKVPPRFGLSLHYARSPTIEASEGTATFERIGGRFDACPLRVGSRDLNVRPCLSFEAGRLLATPENTIAGESQPVPWLAAGAFLSGEVRAPETWAARAELGALFPLRRDDFYFGPGHDIVHEIPPVGVFVSVALELEIP